MPTGYRSVKGEFRFASHSSTAHPLSPSNDPIIQKFSHSFHLSSFADQAGRLTQELETRILKFETMSKFKTSHHQNKDRMHTSSVILII